jgi:DUF4097 and DUF4098 domain-containing protein YvlB
MKNFPLTKASLGCLLCLLIVMAGCCINIGCWPALAKYERQVQLSAPLSPGSVFAAKTHNGSITVTGADVTDCNLTATIIARAGSEEDAKRLAEETKVKLEPFGNKLTVKIQRPPLMMNRSVSVSLDATVPNQTSAELTTHNGALKIKNLTGQLNATTHNGGVTAEQVTGTTNLRTHNGGITCKEISGDTQLRTHNGGIKAAYAKNASPVCIISIVTHNGGVDFTAPPNLSAEVEVATHNGSINTDLPITVIGKVTKRKLTGTIGAGQGKLHLETHNGSIKIR